MEDWNAVITVHDGGFNEARNLLHVLGPVVRTDYYNILAMRAPQPLGLLDALKEQEREVPGCTACLSRVMPVTVTFTFQSPEQFELLARQAVDAFLADLRGKSFYLRMHRRGFKGRLSGQDEERFLDAYLLGELDKLQSQGRISFENPDRVIVLETLGQRAGLSLWTRDQVETYPLLHID
jgi:hypothetical protein